MPLLDPSINPFNVPIPTNPPPFFRMPNWLSGLGSIPGSIQDTIGGGFPSIINPNPPPLGSNPLGQLQPLSPLFGSPDPSATGEYAGGPAGGPAPSIAPPSVPSVPAQPGQPNRPGGIPVIPKSTMTPAAGPLSMTVQGMPLPEAQGYNMSLLPQMAPASGVDYSVARKFLDQGMPSAPDMKGSSDANVAAVLGGLARGAAGVDATRPGSFAAALAAAGAGGEEGRRGEIEKAISRQDLFDREKAKYMIERGHAEMQMAQHQADVRNAQRQVDFQNAKLRFDADFANRNAAYENQLKAYGLSVPKIHSTADGALVESTDPNTGQTKIDFMGTKPHYEKIDAAVKPLEALGLPTTSIWLDALKGLNLSPPEELHEIRLKAISDVLKYGQGGSTFNKKLYSDAVRQVDAEMKSDPAFQIPPTTAQDKMLYEKTRQERLTHAIFNLISNDPNAEAGWRSMANGSHPSLFPYLVGGATAIPPVQ